ncbi:hypothetical protein [Acutalibacter intestini]|uniref:hypothetical protein n=1 Tax=Acutalibacter intestini TaxID=3093659 RepID=UPI002AC92238|nr:hypothetical protein [Acutalibacter sp. M00204]
MPKGTALLFTFFHENGFKMWARLKNRKHRLIAQKRPAGFCVENGRTAYGFLLESHPFWAKRPHSLYFQASPK